MKVSDLTGAVGEVKLTVSITRKETGKVETFEMTGKVTQDQLNELEKENGSNTLNIGA